MANPSGYTPGYNFSGFQEINPTVPLPAQQVDSELADVAAAINDHKAAIEDVRRSDGALKNQVVTPDSLSPAVKNMIAVAGGAGTPLTADGILIEPTIGPYSDVQAALEAIYGGAGANGSRGDVAIVENNSWLRSNSLAVFASVALAVASSFSSLIVPAGERAIPAAIDLGQKVFDVEPGGSFSGDFAALPSGYTWDSGTRFGRSIRNTSIDSHAAVYNKIYPGVTSYDVFQAVLDIGPDTTIHHVSGISSYVRNRVGADGIGRNGVGFFAAATAEVNDAIVWGLNTLLQDHSSRDIHTGTGRMLLGAELDFNCTSTFTQIIGVSAGGYGLVQPSAANAFIANSLSGAETGLYRWTTGFWVPDGCASYGLAIGAMETTGTTIDSIPVLLQYRNASGVKHSVSIRAGHQKLAITTDDSGPLQLQIDSMSLVSNAVIGGAALVPTIIGGGAAGSSLTLSPTYGAGVGAEYIRFVYGNNGGLESARFDGAGRLVMGHTSAVGIGAASTQQNLLQIHGTGTESGNAMYRWVGSAAGPSTIFFKSRGAAIGTRTIVQSGDTLGSLTFAGDDGTNAPVAAQIRAAVDGTPGASDMPGRIEFLTTADGTASATLRLTLNSGGDLLPGATSTYDLGSSSLQFAEIHSAAYHSGGNRVLNGRKTGWATATGTATRTAFDTASVTLPQLAERFKALVDDLHSTAGHGLIGT